MIEEALKYQALGWKIFPCKEKSKQPATPNGFKDATNDLNTIQNWWKAQNYNIALSIEELCIVDVDTHGGVNGYASLAEFDLPSTVTAHTPTGGRHYYFKTNKKVSRKTGFRAGLDRLTNGYVMLPCSEHPDGGNYQWMANRSPWDLEIADLPEAFYEDKPPPTITPWGKQPPKPTTEQKKTILERASLYIHNCEPAIQGMSGHNQLIYAASALVNGFDLTDSEALDILWNEYNPMCSPPWDRSNSSDVKDFERKVGEARKTCTKQRGWLIGDFEDTKADMSPELIAMGKQIQENLLKSIPKQEKKEKPKKVEFNYVETEKPKVIFEKMPSLIKDTVEFIEDCAIVPQPWLTLGAVLTTFGALLGKKYSFRGNRSNLFTISAAPSSSGKENARKQIRKLLELAELDNILGGEEVTSDTAIIKKVKNNPRVLYLWDEIGHMFANTKSDKSSTHQKNIAPTLMKLYSSAGGTYGGKDYADNGNQKDSVKAIKDPHCCFYGTTTPNMMYTAFSGDDADSGFMGRILFFMSKDEPEPKEEPYFGEPDQKLVERIAEFGHYDPIVEEAQGLIKSAGIDCGVKELEATPEAKKLLRKYQMDLYKAKKKESEGPLKGLVGKSFEQICRVCIIGAIASDKEVIDLDVAEWACALVEYLSMECLAISRQRLDASGFKERCLQIFEYIKKKDTGNGVLHSDMLRNISSLTTNELANIRKNLEDSEMITCAKSGNGRGIRYYVNTGAS